jgi:hypothetical protein
MKDPNEDIRSILSYIKTTINRNPDFKDRQTLIEFCAAYTFLCKYCKTN